ncbi:MAG: hypothetical protein WBA05_16560 [Gordonia sp. (in: high G+C Gram-positive bacteria)]|uniref:hypothetical protein n=1 Tax=Gordonia sp. (in: high G+C Gram-positive bacteria) TaxID=84139 RepID=UPI003C77CED1
MIDSNSVFPDDAVPQWARRYTAGAARRHDRFVHLTRNLLPGMRNRRGRRTLAATVVISLDVVLIAAVISFWSIGWASIPLAAGLVVSLTALMMLRIVTGSVGGAPADALDEIQLAQRNAARAICYNLVIPMMLVVYAILIGLSMRETVSGDSLVAAAWLLIALVYSASCLPDVLISWWMADPEPDDFPLDDLPR